MISIYYSINNADAEAVILNDMQLIQRDSSARDAVFHNEIMNIS